MNQVKIELKFFEEKIPAWGWYWREHGSNEWIGYGQNQQGVIVPMSKEMAGGAGYSSKASARIAAKRKMLKAGFKGDFEFMDIK